ncbi:hypothetical protein OA820_09055 [Citrobacter freundii]|uniref:hypothetical protein n=1 Tax=Citrobacter freundii TaxID=546 RepID=UPI000D599478|nr:hypothetical protein [Citrobacter freundii]EKX8996395.1 hypothetical protein [Citrobacter freundii]MDN4203030.1 hypothetical protein [Citrobacter freundii]MDN4208065.1 hypothetical protein [Citrobacter freundii]MDN4210048.1 hypothetical protein [Citrobacter freundii]MDN4218102.1 hypothetical protein [Citrobacter freundii]
MKNNTIEIYRRRIAIAALHRMKRKTGGYCLVINLPNKEIQTIELNEEAFQKLLVKFEKQSASEFGKESPEFIRKTYLNSLDINGHTEYLTETGKMIIDELLSELEAYAKKQYKREVSNG